MYEAAMCHANVFLFPKEHQDPSELTRAGELAIRWAEESHELEPNETQHILLILQKVNASDAALRLISRYREANPTQPPTSFVGDELKVYLKEKRFPEVIQLADRWLADDSGATAELKSQCGKLRDEAMSHMRQIVEGEAGS